jgi:hypothetical protein
LFEVDLPWPKPTTLDWPMFQLTKRRLFEQHPKHLRNMEAKGSKVATAKQDAEVGAAAGRMADYAIAGAIQACHARTNDDLLNCDI